MNRVSGQDDKKLLTLKEYCGYMNIGESKARELLNGSGCTYRVRIGNRLYANKTYLDKWVDSISGR